MPIRSLKLSFNGEIRRFALEALNIVEGQVTLDELKNVARKTYPELNEKEFTLSYQDEDDDVITISTNDEVKEAFAVANLLCATVLRLEVQVSANTSAPVAASANNNKAVHFRVICDGCGANPIIGDRFKCSVRDDFDLCSKCEALDTSKNPYLKIKNPAQCPAAIMTILRPDQPDSRSVSETSSRVSDAFVEKIAITEELYNDKVVDLKEEHVKQEHVKQEPVAEKKQKPVGACPMPSLVRLECLSSLREFGPYYAMRKPNNCMIFLSPSDPAIHSEKPWKSGRCLRLNNRTCGVAMDGNGGPWASFHVEVVKDGSGGGGAPSNVVRLVCNNRRLVLCATGGQLRCAQSTERGVHTHFKINEASNVQEVDPVWDAMSVPSLDTDMDNGDKAAAAEASPVSSPWNDVTPEEERPFWEGMSESLIQDVLAAQGTQPPARPARATPPPPPPIILQSSFVKDITIPDGQVMQTGESFVKVWSLRNDSDVPFPADVKLVHAGGAAMGQTSQVHLDKHPIYPFEEFEVAVPMTAPSKPGKYASFWRLESNGEKFGHQVWVEVMVVESPEKLMKDAQDEADKLLLAKMQAEQDEAESLVLQAAARAQAEEALALEAARVQAEADVAEKEKREAEEIAEQLKQAEADRVRNEELLELELEAVVKAETERIEALQKAEQEDQTEREQDPSSPDTESNSGNSIDWEHVDNVIEDDDEESEPVQEMNGSVGSSDLYASDLSASVEGAAMAGAALHEEDSQEEGSSTHNLSDSLAGLTPYLEDPEVVQWGSAVTRLMEMGFNDVPAIVKACKDQGCAPEAYEAHFQAILDHLLNNM